MVIATTGTIAARPLRSAMREYAAPGRRLVIGDVRRARRRLRCLNAAYDEAENKPLVQHLIEAEVDDLRTLHEVLPRHLN
jgi:hypothetical protein